MPPNHKALEKNFETEMWMNGRKLPLNHFVQESIANTIIGFSKTLKESPENPDTIEIKIRRLTGKMDVDAHTYP
jgi:hypothetical protein